MPSQNRILTLVTLTLIVAASALGGMWPMHGNSVKKPAASEFGTGPRTSARGLYVVTMNGAGALQPRKMYTFEATVINAATRQAVTNAMITIDGGMPEHGHGLPTRPRMTGEIAGGRYTISGVRFNMGGWWELKLTITTPAGTDTVTFNLSL